MLSVVRLVVLQAAGRSWAVRPSEYVVSVQLHGKTRCGKVLFVFQSIASRPHLRTIRWAVELKWFDEKRLAYFSPLMRRKRTIG